MNQEIVTKKCSNPNCSQPIKPISEFYKNGKFYRSNCKTCQNNISKLWVLNNYQKRQKTIKKWRLENSDYDKIRRLKNPEYFRVMDRQWRMENPEKQKAKEKRWRMRHPKHNTIRRKLDLNFRIKGNLRSRLRRAFKNNQKRGHMLELLCCTINELKIYLEKLFTIGMSWDNYGRGGWDIDHIIPVSSFNLTNPEQQKKAFHYTNLQPMWHLDNIKKGDKIIVPCQSR